MTGRLGDLEIRGIRPCCTYYLNPANKGTYSIEKSTYNRRYRARWVEVGDFESIKHDLSVRSFSNQIAYSQTWSQDEILDVLKKYGIYLKQRQSMKPGGVSLKLWGTGSPRREFLHVDDLANAVIHLLQKISANDIYEQNISHINIGTGKDITIKELAELVKEIVGFEGEIQWDDSKPDGTPQKLLDIQRLNSFGWKPEISLRTGIEETCSDLGYLSYSQ